MGTSNGQARVNESRRVVHVVCSAGFAGVERYISYVAPCLARRGWEVTVVGGNTERMHDALGDIRHVHGASLASAMAALTRFDRTAIVHAHMTEAESAAVAMRVVRRFPIVVTRHFGAPRGSSRLGHLVAPLIRRGISEQIAVSDFVAAAIDEPSVTIRNAVPDAYETAARDRHIVLVVQRLEGEKLTADALRAWTGTPLPALGWKLLIAGEGREHARLAELAHELGVSQSVELLGARSDTDELMRSATIFVATAPAEPFGLSVVEAMAAGLPVIATRAGAHLETVGAVTTRWMYRPGEHAELSSMLQALALDHAERARYGRALQEHQRAALSLDAHVDQLETLYERLRR